MQEVPQCEQGLTLHQKVPAAVPESGLVGVASAHLLIK